MIRNKNFFLIVIFVTLIFLIVFAGFNYLVLKDNNQINTEQIQPNVSLQFYFAYGSNMSLANMKSRCGAGAQVIGPALLVDYQLTFDKRGYANIIPQSNQQVWGVAWQINQDCLKALDRYEGYPQVYDRQNVQIIWKQQAITAMVYVEPADQSGGQPSRSYMDNRVIPGAKENGLPAEWINKLEQY